LDKAGWHISRTLSIPDNLVLLHLPPYSPELNPVELLWRALRRKHFHNKIFQSLNEVEDTLATALAQYHQQPAAIQNYPGTSYLTILMAVDYKGLNVPVK